MIVYFSMVQGHFFSIINSHWKSKTCVGIITIGLLKALIASRATGRALTRLLAAMTSACMGRDAHHLKIRHDSIRDSLFMELDSSITRRHYCVWHGQIDNAYSCKATIALRKKYVSSALLDATIACCLSSGCECPNNSIPSSSFHVLSGEPAPVHYRFSRMPQSLGGTENASPSQGL